MSLPILSHLISFRCPIILAKISSTILNRHVESGQSCNCPDFSEIALSLAPFQLMFAMNLQQIAFIVLRYVPNTPNSGGLLP